MVHIYSCIICECDSHVNPLFAEIFSLAIIVAHMYNNRCEKGVEGVPKTEKKFDQTSYTREFHREHYYRIPATFPKDCRERIEAAAQAAGVTKSTYITRAVLDSLERDGF